LSYTLPADILGSEASAEGVKTSLKEDDSWEKVENTVTYQGVSSNSFEILSGSSDGVYAVRFPRRDEDRTGVKELDVQSLTLTSQDGEVKADLVIGNNGQRNIQDTIDLERNGESVKQWNISLKPGETEELSYTSSSGRSESYTFSAGSKTRTIEPRASEDGGIPVYLKVLAGLLIVLGAVIVYVYIIEYRRAQELEEVIEGIKRG